jgi:hypothetical protein
VNTHQQAEPEQQHDQAADQKADQEALARLLDQAEKGDRTVLPELRKLLHEHPRLWSGCGDLALQARASMIQQTAGSNLLMSESLLWKTAAMKEELAGEAASPLERLLADRVVATWLDVHYHEALLAQPGPANEARARLLERRHDAANRRHLAAVKMLATVRKLLTPALSPVQIASRLEGQNPALRRCREGIAGTIPVTN